MNSTSPDYWTAGGVLLGFQVTAMWWRVQREVSISKPNIPIRISPADYLNLAAMMVLGIGVFIYPTLFTPAPDVQRLALGLSSILFIGHAFGLIAHYDLFNPNTARPGKYCPRPEKFAVTATAAAAIIYLLLAIGSL